VTPAAAWPVRIRIAPREDARDLSMSTQHPGRRRPYYGWVLVVTLGITETITWGILYYGFAVFLPVMEADLGWSRGEMAGAFSLATLLAGLCAAPVGRWLDDRGPRLLMTAGSIAATVLVLAWSQVTDLAQFYVLWALIGMTMATVLYEPAFAVVTAWFERKRTRALTAVTLMAGFASTIFMPIESWLIEVQGWRTALMTLAAFLAITTILPHALLLRRRPEDLGLHVDGEGAASLAPARSARPPTVSVGAALRDAPFRWLVVAFSLSTLVSFAVHVHLVAYLQDRGYEATLAATATGLVGAMQVLGRIVLGLLGDRVSLRASTAVALAIQPVSLLILLLVPGPLGVFAFIALFGASKGAQTLVRPAYVAALYGRARYASIAGALAAFVTAANALAPVSGGAAHDSFGSYEPLLWAFVGLSAIAAGAALLVGRGPAPVERSGSSVAHPAPSQGSS
jgi:MFS family permease